MEEEEGLKRIKSIQQLNAYLLSKSYMTRITLLTLLTLTFIYNEIVSHLLTANIKHLTLCSYSTPFVFSKGINTLTKNSPWFCFPIISCLKSQIILGCKCEYVYSYLFRRSIALWFYSNSFTLGIDVSVWSTQTVLTNMILILVWSWRTEAVICDLSKDEQSCCPVALALRDPVVLCSMTSFFEYPL